MGKPHSNYLLTNSIFLLVMATSELCNCNRNSENSTFSKLRCDPFERKALLEFKNSVTFHDRHVSLSWEGQDCCSWHGVRCTPVTGHVMELHLHGRCPPSVLWPCNYLFEAENMESSLLYLHELNHLEYLDISINNFHFSKIPKSVGSMKQLRYLNLSHNTLSGVVPDELGNLTNLQVLDLSFPEPRFDHDSKSMVLLMINRLNWVTNLRKLVHLDLSFIDLSEVNELINSVIRPLPFLTELHLSNCNISTQQTRLHSKNSSVSNTLIRHLDLSSNNLEGGIPHFVENLTSLEYLDLSYNELGSFIPVWLRKLKNLVHLHLKYSALVGIEGGNLWSVVKSHCRLRSLDLRGNQLQGNFLEPRKNVSYSTNCTNFGLELLDLSYNFDISGSIPSWLGEEFSSLKFLSLGSNSLSGEIPTSLGMLSELEFLDTSNNPLKGEVLSETHFSNLSSLTQLDLSQTYVTIKLSSNWVPRFQLHYLDVTACKINGPFPKWLRTQKQIEYLFLSNTQIHGVLPNWFRNMTSLFYVKLSHNQLTGCPTFPVDFMFLSLYNNSITCSFMTNDSNENTVHQYAKFLDLSDNFISGELPDLLYQRMPYLVSVFLSENLISGLIPKSICHISSLRFLALEKNMLLGTIPHCLGYSVPLISLDLSFNNLSGSIPCFRSMYSNNESLVYLHLNDNILSGRVPSCLANLGNLTLFDAGENELLGEIPTWITGENFPNLQILRLRSNKLNGIVPNQVCSLPDLRVMDFGHNYLTGTIPDCLSNLTNMIQPSYASQYYYDIGVAEIIQGTERDFTSTLDYLVSIDLSCNNLVGSIPEGITVLESMVSLNLSYNQITGSIPLNIGTLKSLVSLDLSSNKLHGIIPTSMAELYSLEHLNLSYNNFSGQIPTGYQLQTLNDPSIYTGNPNLCGDPLPTKCHTKNEGLNGSEDNDSQEENGIQYDEDEDKREMMWFYLVVMAGVATGFWGVVGTLLVKRSWRYAFFRCVDDAQGWLYETIVVRIANLMKKM